MNAVDVVNGTVTRPTSVSQVTAVEQARAVAEVLAAVQVAQQCPRDMQRARAEMREACGRLALAERAFYSVPNRGTGPSVHLARELARVWGNIDYGVRELRRDDAAGESEVQAFAWDQQTNTRSTRSFIVPHYRTVGKGPQKRREKLEDLNDIYLSNQNIGARAVRECIFAVLPGDFATEAETTCRATIEKGDGKPLEQRIAEMLTAWRTTHNVTEAQIAQRLGRSRGQWTAGDVANLGVVYLSIQRGETTVAEEFPAAPVTAERLLAPVSPRADEPALEDPAGVDYAAVQEAASAEPIGDAPLITEPMNRKLHALLGRTGRADRETGLRYLTLLLDRQVDSTKTLTKAEAHLAIDDLEAEERANAAVATEQQLPIDQERESGEQS